MGNCLCPKEKEHTEEKTADLCPKDEERTEDKTVDETSGLLPRQDGDSKPLEYYGHPVATGNSAGFGQKCFG